MTVLSDYVLKAPLRTDEVVTVVTVPSGKTTMQFYTDLSLVYARKGSVDAGVPDSNYVTDGTSSFPYAGGQAHRVAVTGGERITFVTQTATEGALFIAFE